MASKACPQGLHRLVKFMDNDWWRVLMSLLMVAGVGATITLAFIIKATDINIDGDGNTIGVYSPELAQSEFIVDCPEGWAPLAASDAELFVLACTNGDPEVPRPGDWFVILEADGRTFDVAYQNEVIGAEFVEDPAKVPGWSN